MDYQKTLRLRELLRDLENTVINGAGAGNTPQGSGTVRRTMRGIIPSLATNVFKPNVGGFPTDVDLTETQLNLALRLIWEQTSSRIDTIVVNGYQKRRINGFITASQRYATAEERVKSLVSVYESDFGVCRVLLSRYVPADALIFLDSTKAAVVPLSGRSFQYKALAVSMEPGPDASWGMAKAKTSARSRSATDTAPTISVSGRTQANPSRPKRANRSPGR